MEKLGFLETWKMNWGSAKATNHCGTFTCDMACYVLYIIHFPEPSLTMVPALFWVSAATPDRGTLLEYYSVNNNMHRQ